jgi:hypothetical protein
MDILFMSAVNGVFTVLATLPGITGVSKDVGVPLVVIDPGAAFRQLIVKLTFSLLS